MFRSNNDTSSTHIRGKPNDVTIRLFPSQCDVMVVVVTEPFQRNGAIERQ